MLKNKKMEPKAKHTGLNYYRRRRGGKEEEMMTKR
jgi:hypothetical protein